MFRLWTKADRARPAWACRSLLALAMAVAVPHGASAQQPTVQPLQGQAPEQVQQDMAACQNSATQATDYTPRQQPLPPLHQDRAASG